MDYEDKGLWKNYMDDWAWCKISPRTKGFSFNAPGKCTLSVP